MGFGSVNKGVMLAGASSVSAYMSSAGSGFSAGSGYSVGSGKGYSTVLTTTTNPITISAASQLSKVYNVSAGSGFSSGSTLSQFATMKTTAFGVKDETAGVTTLKGAMAV
ncbi:flagellin, partial [Campylobacter coli]|nr:flagellin [Campylobacter coli]